MDVGVLRHQSARTKVLELDVWKPAEVVVPWHVISSRVVFVFVFCLICVSIFQIC